MDHRKNYACLTEFDFTVVEYILVHFSYMYTTISWKNIAPFFIEPKIQPPYPKPQTVNPKP